jgi:uncharacterized protein YaaN involved in tellurite resistance
MDFTMEVPKDPATKNEVPEPFSLRVPDEEAIEKEVLEQVKPVPEEVAQIKVLAERNAEIIWTMDNDGIANRDILQKIESFGVDSVKRAAAKNSLLQVAVGNLSKDGDEGGLVAKGLTDLQQELEDLDPSLIDFTKTGILGKLSKPIRSYFAKYQKADSAIADIIASLEKGKKTLDNDNTTLGIEKRAMRDLTKKLNKEIQFGTLMSEAIQKLIEAAKARDEDPEKVIFVTDEVLFPLGQRINDMMQMIVVNQQGIMATELVIRNNKELIRGVERAQTVTISALRISVMVASALYNQKIVLKKIQMLNYITNKLIDINGRMLNEQGKEIYKQLIEPDISIEGMKNSFADTMEAFDSISAYKKEALPKIIETTNQFKELAANGEELIQKLERGNKLGL